MNTHMDVCLVKNIPPQ